MSIQQRDSNQIKEPSLEQKATPNQHMMLSAYQQAASGQLGSFDSNQFLMNNYLVENQMANNQIDKPTGISASVQHDNSHIMEDQLQFMIKKGVL